MAPCIGKKIAQRVILELKDKLAKGQTINGAGETYGAVSYTHLDVYKRQPLRRPGDGGPGVPGAAGYLTGGRGVAAGPGAVPAGAG